MTAAVFVSRPADIRRATARYAARCGQCRSEIRVGDVIGQPQVRNRSGGREFGGWYCVECASRITEELAAQYPRDAQGRLRSGIPYLSAADSDASISRARQVRERHSTGGAR